MKAILISIRPEWVAKILNGEKTLEIRKTFPKCDLPIDVYIYCTKKEPYARRYVHNDKWGTLEYIKSDGKVVAKFKLKKITDVKYLPICSSSVVNYRPYESYVYEDITPSMNKTARLSFEEIHKYLNGKDGYAWHIDELKILDKPLELTCFHKRGTQKKIDELWDRYRNSNPHDHIVDSCIMAEESKILWDNEITRAPQSWCFAEVEVNNNG